MFVKFIEFHPYYGKKQIYKLLFQFARKCNWVSFYQFSVEQLQFWFRFSKFYFTFWRQFLSVDLSCLSSLSTKKMVNIYPSDLVGRRSQSLTVPQSGTGQSSGNSPVPNSRSGGSLRSTKSSNILANILGPAFDLTGSTTPLPASSTEIFEPGNPIEE